MGRNQPRNRLGQYASYRSTMEGGAEPSKLCKQPILLDSDSEDLDPPLQEQQSNIQSSVKSPQPSGKGKNPAKASTNPKFPRFFPAEFYDDSENTKEVSSDDLEYDYSSDDVESMMDDLEKVFGKAEKKMCSRADGDPEKTKKVITKVMEWLYLKVVDVKLAPRRKKARTSSKKK